ncbi:hypothetical protein GNP63_12515 [Aliivibrio fischeri]|uniref:hypothetical protein n=1 Tax=Aliivibrio fischeri TaxID=668 RepID=UPI0012D907DD|nr:hypothetical protein [Aliivibrio fischeri]MUH97360.1 hypothetical protein [Aliivibrio fischeri]MUI64973.1 hypothetical protein [Aliivibrio fischeri]
MARKLQLLPTFFLNMDNLVSWQLEDDLIIIDTTVSTLRVGIDAYTNDVQVTSSDLQRIINEINAYFD